jgi:spore photoproduct lyase
MKPYRPEQIFVERAIEDSPITQNVLDRLPGVPTRSIDSTDFLLEESQRWNPTIPRSKQSLILAHHKGKFFKPCPGSRAKEGLKGVCCNYFVINFASNCHMECSYCYLQSYLNFPYMTIYANQGDLISELEAVFAGSPHEFFRIGTGELADSLALDWLTGYSTGLVEFFARQANAVLELKTKSNCVENLLGLEHGGKTVVSWSMNPRYVQEKEEHKTASISQRLQAAAECARQGYPVGFHLDPLIHYPAWETDYRDLIEDIFHRVPAASIAWISVGSLRMTSSLKDIMRRRFPSSFLPLGELVPCPDGKMRYFKPLRVGMYRQVLKWIRAKSPTTQVYACMEGPGVWKEVFQSVPTEAELGEELIQCVV